MERVAATSSATSPRLRLVACATFNVYGPGESHKAKAASMIWQLHGQMKAGRRPRIFKFGEQFRDFIYVKDVVAANRKAAEAGASGAITSAPARPRLSNRIIEVLNSAMGTRLEPEYFDNPYSFYQKRDAREPAAAKGALGFRRASPSRKHQGLPGRQAHPGRGGEGLDTHGIRFERSGQDQVGQVHQQITKA